MSRKKGKSVKYSFFVLALGAHTVRIGQADGQHAGVVILFQIVPADVLADFDVGLDRDSEFDQALDLAIKHVWRQNPIRNTAAIQSACLRRFLEDGYL